MRGDILLVFSLLLLSYNGICQGRKRFLRMVETHQHPQPIVSSARSAAHIASKSLPILATLATSSFVNKLPVLASQEYGTKLPLSAEAYTNIGGLSICRLVSGMWQVSGAHGFIPDEKEVVKAMTRCAETGLTTFDAADIYGPAEDFIGAFRSSSSLAGRCQFLTKWVPRPTRYGFNEVERAIRRSMDRMQTDKLDLLQFHWWDYDNPYYVESASHLTKLKEVGYISNLGLTNFDTAHLRELISRGVPIVSNQVAFSVLDTRPSVYMVPTCLELGVKLLCYGVLLGGFISPAWLNQPAPASNDVRLSNVSLRKYLPWIGSWGGWELFQKLLRTLDSIATKHNQRNANLDITLSHVAIRFILQQPAVGGVLIGQRFGLGQSDHSEDNKKVFLFQLDEEDVQAIQAVQGQGQALVNRFGDCGGEYRRR